jgi:hypothetical protein
MRKKKAGVTEDGSAKILINKAWVQLTDPNDYLQYLLTVVSHFKYSPFEVVKENLVAALDIFDDMCEAKGLETAGKEKAKWTRALKDSNILRERFGEAEDLDQINKIYYEKLLALSGLGTLRGFGACTRFGDKLYGDVEKIPIDQLWSRL